MEKKKIWHKPKTNHKIWSHYDRSSVIWEFNYREDWVRVVRVIDLAGRLGIIDRADYQYQTAGSEHSLAKFVIDMKRDPCYSTAPAQQASQSSDQSLP